MKRTQPEYVAPTCIEAYPLCSDLTTRTDMLAKMLEQPASAEEAVDRRERFAARANSILAFVECSERVRPKLRDAIVEAMLWARKQA